MSEHIIRLPESLYRSLLAAAEAKGLTPASWIASQLSTPAETIATEEAQPSYEFPEDLIGSIDSEEKYKDGGSIDSDGILNPTAADNQSRPLSELLAEAGLFDETADSKSCVSSVRPVKKDDAFGEALIADMARQGIYIP
ncbi:MAG: hypothetical protein DCF25_07360 [Leptolyngbya foveolarum]|uniref:Uncharacterized protein n=1 Tax=Leptolyngbya foveolarum TaxID=47253 RepID=A0A2W4WC26_9CYAN|nr:MAG: hypothetical protein DCF25_07360 [Leptolyngbya foveolarum]